MITSPSDTPHLGVVLPSGGEMVTTPVGSVIVTHFDPVGTHVAVYDQPDRDPAVTIRLPGDGTMLIELRDTPRQSV